MITFFNSDLITTLCVSHRVMATFRTVFWSLFGRGEPDAVRLGDDYDNHLTEDIGYIIYGIYNIVMVTVLINMLIAMMTRSFTNIAVSCATGVRCCCLSVFVYLFVCCCC